MDLKHPLSAPLLSAAQAIGKVRPFAEAIADLESSVGAIPKTMDGEASAWFRGLAGALASTKSFKATLEAAERALLWREAPAPATCRAVWLDMDRPHKSDRAQAIRAIEAMAAACEGGDAALDYRLHLRRIEKALRPSKEVA